MILQMLSKKIGQELNCIVSGLTNFGVFVQCKKFGIEGLIRMDDLGPDTWKYNDKTQSIIGQHSGICVRLGQSIKASIVSVNIPARQLNLSPVEPLVKEKPVKNKTRTKEKRKYTKKRKRRNR